MSVLNSLFPRWSVCHTQQNNVIISWMCIHFPLLFSLLRRTTKCPFSVNERRHCVILELFAPTRRSLWYSVLWLGQRRQLDKSAYANYPCESLFILHQSQFWCSFKSLSFHALTILSFRNSWSGGQHNGEDGVPNDTLVCRVIWLLISRSLPFHILTSVQFHCWNGGISHSFRLLRGFCALRRKFGAPIVIWNLKGKLRGGKETEKISCQVIKQSARGKRSRQGVYLACHVYFKDPTDISMDTREDKHI